MKQETTFPDLWKQASVAWDQCFTHEICDILEIVQNRTVTIIGSGCSFPLAVLLASLVQHNSTQPVSFTTPYSFMNSRFHSDITVIVTAKGSSLHTISAYSNSLARGVPVIVITTDCGSTLSTKALRSGSILIDTPIVYTEDSFVPVYTSAALSALIANACRVQIEGNPYHYQLNNAMYSVHRAKSYHIVVGTPWALPAAYELETRIVEYGVGTCAISDVWNLAHGRYMTSVGTHTPIVVLGACRRTSCQKKITSIDASESTISGQVGV